MNPTQLLQHFDRISEAPDAILRLRRFILDLAVRSKLVEQDPNDEPASELIKRIRAEKTRLLKEGKIRKQDELPSINDEERIFSIPTGWAWGRLANLSRKIHYGFTASANKSIKDIRLLRITDIQENTVDWSSVPGCDISNDEIPQYKLECGDILIARTGGTIGKTFLVRNIPVIAVFASYLIRVQGSSELYDQYLKLFMESPVYWKQLQDGARGAGQPNVNGQTLGQIHIPLPPLPEQHRIVAKVDELMALCDQLEAAKAEREQSRDRLVAASLKRLNDLGQRRHSGMDCRTHSPGANLDAQSAGRSPNRRDAVSSPEHREVNAGAGSESIPTGQLDRGNPCLNDGDKLNATGMDASLNLGTALPGDWIPAIPAGMTDAESIASFLNHLPRITTRPEHIKQLRQTILNLAVRGKLVAQDPNDELAAELLKLIKAEREKLIEHGRIRREKPLAILPESKRPFMVPDSWEWVKIGDAAIYTEYGTSQQSAHCETGVPVLKMGDIQDGMLVLGGQKKVSQTIDDLPALYLKKYDLLYNRTNSAELVGKTGIYLGEDDEYTFASYLIRIRCSRASTNPVYFNIAMNAPFFRTTQIIPHLKQQCGQANVNGTILKNMAIPLPPLPEQHRIVAKVDELMALCDQLENQLTATEADSRRLLEAVLHETLSPALAEVA